MAVNVDWKNEQQNCIIITFHRPWNWDEFKTANLRVDTLFHSVKHQVDLILDITDGGFPPAGAIQEFKKVSENRHQNLGKIVVVGIPFFFRGMLNLIRNVYQGRYEAPGFLFEPTLEKAYEMLKRPEPAPESKLETITHEVIVDSKPETRSHELAADSKPEAKNP
jgi:hypothetical protein